MRSSYSRHDFRGRKGGPCGLQFLEEAKSLLIWPEGNELSGQQPWVNVTVSLRHVLLS